MYLLVERSGQIRKVDQLVGTQLEEAKKDVRDKWLRIFRFSAGKVKEMKCPYGISVEWEEIS